MAWPNDFGTIPTNAQGTTPLADATDDHALAHRQLGSIVNALGTKLGLTSGTPALNQLLIGGGGGSASWGTIANGLTFGSATLGTPAITGGTITNTLYIGTINNTTFGTPAITGGTANNLTLGTPVIQAWNNWVSANETWTVVGTAAQFGTIGLPLTASAKYDKGDRLQFVQGGTTQYMHIFSLSGTTAVIAGGTNYVLGTNIISANYYSKALSPNGYPQWYNFTTAWTGFNGNPTGTWRYQIMGNTCYMQWMNAGDGTSNATTLTFTVPVAPVQNNEQICLGFTKDNGAEQTTPGHGKATGGSVAIQCFKTYAENAWTNVNTKYFNALPFFYEF